MRAVIIFCFLLLSHLAHADEGHICAGEDYPLELSDLVSEKYLVAHERIEESSCAMIPLDHTKYKNRPTENVVFDFFDYGTRDISIVECKKLKWIQYSATDSGCENWRELHLDYPTQKNSNKLTAPLCRIRLSKVCPKY